MEYVYIIIALIIILGCYYSWKHRRKKPRDRAREYKDMFEQYRPKDKGELKSIKPNKRSGDEWGRAMVFTRRGI